MIEIDPYLDPWKALEFLYDCEPCLICGKVGRCEHRDTEVAMAQIDAERRRLISFLKAAAQARRPPRRETARSRPTRARSQNA